MSSAADGWFDQEWQDAITRRLGRAVAVSLAVHLGVLIVVAFVRLPQLGERPLASMEISLASLPTPPTSSVKVSDPPKASQKVTEVPKPVMPTKSAALPAPVAPAPKLAAVPLAPPVKLSNDVMRD